MVLPPQGNYQLILSAVEIGSGKVLSAVHEPFCVTGNYQGNCNAAMSLDTYGPVAVGNAVEIRTSPVAGATYDRYQLFAFATTPTDPYYYNPVIISPRLHFTETTFKWTTAFGLNGEYYVVAIMYMVDVAVSTCQTPSLTVTMPDCIFDATAVTKPMFAGTMNAGNTSTITWVLQDKYALNLYVSAAISKNISLVYIPSDI